MVHQINELRGFFYIFNNIISMSFSIIQTHFTHFLQEINKGILIGKNNESQKYANNAL